MQAIQAESGDRGINLNSWQAPASIWVEASQGGYVFVGERWYRGRVRLILQNDGLLAVNQVGLEDYLTSVVGSEMYAHWPIEALKAQAVAARSYALARYVQPPAITITSVLMKPGRFIKEWKQKPEALAQQYGQPLDKS